MKHDKKKQIDQKKNEEIQKSVSNCIKINQQSRIQRNAIKRSVKLGKTG